ncbi:MAG: hypothetical protein WDZ68_01105 [Candidatus Paceibacterota bacterium]
MFARTLSMFFAIVIISFALPAIAAELECNYEPTPPDAVFIELVKERRPSLNEAEVVKIARTYELIYYQSVLANNEKATELTRAFASRTEQIGLRLVAVQFIAYEILPEMESVLEKMEAEKAAGLEKVSEELKPEVRSTAHKMIAIGIEWSEISDEITRLFADRFKAIVNQHDEAQDVLAEAERGICTLQTSMEIMSGVAESLPQALILAYVEDLYY